MKRRLIPETQLNASLVCMGTGEIGSSVSRDDSFRLLDAMMERGGNFIDTAKDYGDWVPGIERSVSEKTVGRWMESRGVRKQMVIATKGCMPDAETTPTTRCAPKTLRRHIEWSQNTLRVDTIDIWYVHKDDPDEPMENIVETLHEMQQKGAIRYYALSNTSLERVEEAQRLAAQKGYAPFIGVQGMWNAAVLQKYPYGDAQNAYMNDSRYAYHQQEQLPWFAYQSTAFGLFHRFAAQTLDQMNPGFKSFYNLPKSEKRFYAIDAIAQKHDTSITAVILAYIYSNPAFPAFPIVGSHKLPQVIDNFSCGELMLTAEEFSQINADIPFEMK